MKSVRFNDEISVVEIPKSERKQSSSMQYHYLKLAIRRNSKIVHFSRNIQIYVVPSYHGFESTFWYTADEIKCFEKESNCFSVTSDNESLVSSQDSLFVKVRTLLSNKTVTNKTIILPSVQKPLTIPSCVNNSAVKKHDSLDNIYKQQQRPTSASGLRLFKLHNKSTSQHTASKPNSNILDTINAIESK